MNRYRETGPAGTMRTAITATTVVLAGVFFCAQAQWLNYPTPGTPRTREGKANLSAATPRALNRKPDLSGVWEIEPTPPGEIERMLHADMSATIVTEDDPRLFSKYFFNILADFKPEDAPVRPELAERLRRRKGPPINTETSCLPLGFPRVILVTSPFKIIQAPTETVFIYEPDNTHRQVLTDGRELPRDPQPSWLGYSVGRWDRDTLVVDTSGLNDKVLLDGLGHPRSEATRMTERYRRLDFGHLQVEITTDDPVNYIRPFTIRVNMRLIPDSDVLESFCNENEQDLRHLAP
jgi:hypothetical protein